MACRPPGQLFYSTQIPACLWFLARDKKNHKFRDRRGAERFVARAIEGSGLANRSGRREKGRG